MGARYSAPVQTDTRARSASCTMGSETIPGVKSGRGVTLTPQPLLVPRSRKSRVIPPLPLWAVRPVQCFNACTSVHFNFTYTSTPSMDRTACTEPQCLYNGALQLYLYLYSPYGPYGLCRASVPVQGCTLPSPFIRTHGVTFHDTVIPIARNDLHIPHKSRNSLLTKYLQFHWEANPLSLSEQISYTVLSCLLKFYNTELEESQLL